MSVVTSTEDALDKRVYLTLRDAIFKRIMLPGEKVSILALSKELGVSRTPIRLAMQRLATEGLIEMAANRAPKVTRPSSKNAIEIFYMRTLLEPAAASLAARYATESDLEDLRKYIEHEKAMLESRNFIDYLMANIQTHSHIAQMSRNEALKDTIQQFLEKSTIVLFHFDPFYYYSEAEIYADYEEGSLIFEAIKDKDEKKANQKMKAHIIRALNALPVDSLDVEKRTLPRLK